MPSGGGTAVNHNSHSFPSSAASANASACSGPRGSRRIPRPSSTVGWGSIMISTVVDSPSRGELNGPSPWATLTAPHEYRGSGDQAAAHHLAAGGAPIHRRRLLDAGRGLRVD